eukprot:g43604.t1
MVLNIEQSSMNIPTFDLMMEVIDEAAESEETDRTVVDQIADDRMALVSGISLDPEAAIGVTKKLPPKWVDGVEQVLGNNLKGPVMQENGEFRGRFPMLGNAGEVTVASSAVMKTEDEARTKGTQCSQRDVGLLEVAELEWNEVMEKFECS